MISVDYPQSKCEKQFDKLPGREELKKFVFEDCKAEANWNMKNFIEDQLELIREQVGDRKVLLRIIHRNHRISQCIKLLANLHGLSIHDAVWWPLC